MRLPEQEEGDLPDRIAVLAPAETAGQRSLRILAVDDNIDLADTLELVLGLWGHTVRIAHDGVAALEVANSFCPDVLLLDLGLPKMDGIEVARRLRQTFKSDSVLLLSM